MTGDRPRAAILAVDGGNSKTDVALVAADGTLLAALRGPTTSHQQVGLETGADRLASLVAEVHRILMRGGVFLYPLDLKDPATPARLLLPRLPRQGSTANPRRYGGGQTR